ncbi:MAG: VOC family protein [Candidatus Dormibacteria bacterium]
MTTATAVGKVVHFEVLGKNGPRLRDFYSKIFGWDFNLMEGGPDYGTIEGAEGGIGGGVGESTDGPTVTFYIEVPNLETTLAEITAAGGTVVTPPTEIPGVVTFANFRDVEGNVVGIIKSQD